MRFMANIVYFEDWMSEHDWISAKYQLQIDEMAKVGAIYTREKLEEADISQFEEGYIATYKRAKQIEIILYKELGFHGTGIFTHKDLLNLFSKYFGKTVSIRTLGSGLKKLKEDDNIIITKTPDGKTQYFVCDVEPWIPSYIKKHGI
jgi:hypothetical protein